MLALLQKTIDFFLKSKTRLFILVVVLALMLVYLWTTSTRETSLPISQNDPQQQEKQIAKTRFVSSLPIDTDEYLIEYFPDREYFFVQVRKNPYKEYKLQIESFFRRNNVEPNDVTIEWGSVRGVGP